jgi:hypothetical protein
MATRTEIIKICDVCQRRTSDEHEEWYGGHPFAGWFTLQRHRGSTDLRSLRQKSTWDLCSKTCLDKLNEDLDAF